MAKVERNSNIELLRIFSMLAIIFGHFIGESGEHDWNTSANDYLLILFGSGGRIAVNVFLLIGVWYMVDSKFKASRVLKLYTQLFFYCYIITIITLFLTDSYKLSSVFRAFFPLILRPLWFASAYITLMIFKPFLDKILMWEKDTLFKFTVFLMALISVISTIPKSNEMGYIIDTVWFGVIYIFIGYIKKYSVTFKHKNLMAIIGTGGYICLTLLRYYAYVNEKNTINNLISTVTTQYIQDIKSLPNFIIAFCLFYWVINLPEKHNKIINTLSVSTFSVYIIHQVPVFYPFLWSNIFMVEKWLPEHNFLYALFVTITVFLACSIIDIPRRKWIEPAVMNSKTVKWVESKMDNVFKDITVQE